MYQDIPNFGTLGGLIEKLPVMLMCGSFRDGRLHEKLKHDLIREMAPDTVDRAASSFEENADLMLSSTELTVDFAEFKCEENELCMPLSDELADDLAAESFVEK